MLRARRTVERCQLYEEYPARYSVDVSRRYRWIRGDWQLAGWLCPRSRSRTDASRRIRFQHCLDGKFSTTCDVASYPLPCFPFVLGWTVLSPFWLWTLSTLALILSAPLLAAFVDLFRKPEDVRFNQHLTSTARATAQHLTQALLTLMCLPYEGFYSLGAILRTAGRMWFTRTRLLEWNPSQRGGQNQQRAGRRLPSRCGLARHGRGDRRRIDASRADALMVAAPILSLWLGISLFRLVDRPTPPSTRARLTSEQTVFLRKMARKTWAFFETLSAPMITRLPPDNYQEHPAPQIAHRTSPTNMGLALLANLSAYDFGYIRPDD